MNLKSKIALATGMILLFTTVIISTISIYSIKKKANQDIVIFRQNELIRVNERLKDIVDVVYDIVEFHYKGSLEGTSTNEEGLRIIEKLRFDEGEGYIWIINNTLPYPSMVMHAAKPHTNGIVLSDPKAYNVVKDKPGKNLHQEIVEICNRKGEATVEYFREKPGKDKVTVYHKLAYSRVFKPLGWVLSTGAYTDAIDRAVAKKATDVNSQINTIIITIIIVSIVILVISVLIANYFSQGMVETIVVAKNRLKDLSKGKIVDLMERKRKDELGDMTSSLNDLVNKFMAFIDFAREIGQRNLEVTFEDLSEEDVLGNELVNMKDSLKKNAEDERIRNWSTEGAAKFANILRDQGDINKLYDEIVLNYVKYLEASQGVLYIIEEENDEKYLKMVAAYAYNRKKFIDGKVLLGEGLAGQCVLENASIYLTDIPDEYINITSGLGEASPDTILITPLKRNEEVLGVLEIASFDQMSDYQIEFAEEICESIASTIANAKINEHTKKLLEESNEMAQNMKAQEEELRQSQEELEATQEEMRRRQGDLEKENKMLKEKLGIEEAEPKSVEEN